MILARTVRSAFDGVISEGSAHSIAVYAQHAAFSRRTDVVHLGTGLSGLAPTCRAQQCMVPSTSQRQLIGSGALPSRGVSFGDVFLVGRSSSGRVDGIWKSADPV